MAPSRQVIGHLDKRKALTRCKPCAKRRIKCHGGFPCEYCTRTGKLCEPQAPGESSNAFQFVAYHSTRDKPVALIPPAVDTDRTSLYLNHFIAVITSCQFTSRFPTVAIELLPLMDGNEHLWNIAIAIGALDANRRGQVGKSSLHLSPQMVAFSSYQQALSRLQDKLTLSDAPQRDDLLWTTFLLGLFELMSEPTGDRWARHMLYGTGRMLQLVNMNDSPSLLKQMLFEAFQILEANRAIMYGVNTFLSDGRWVIVRRTQLLTTGRTDSLPMDEIITLMIYTASFSQQFFEQIGHISEPERHSHPCIDALGHEGIHVQHLLKAWYSQHSTIYATNESTHEFKLALLYYHAILLFLSRNYTYYPYWDNKPTPLLDDPEVIHHTCYALDLMQELLESSGIPGVMLLFPLRVVGSLLNQLDTRTRLIRQLDAIYWKGYVVADRVKIDLEDLWEFTSV